MFDCQLTINSSSIGTILFGTLERLLCCLVFTMLTILINYTNWVVATKFLQVPPGTTVFGQDPLLSLKTDLLNLKKAVDSATPTLASCLHTSSFRWSKWIDHGILMVVLWLPSTAMYPDKRKHMIALYRPNILTGVTEPIEYMFMFIAANHCTSSSSSALSCAVLQWLTC